MLIDANNSALLVIDVQEKLLPAVEDWQRVLDNVIWLVRVARRVGVPVIASEQYPRGLGHSHPDLAAELPPGAIAEKMHFSCVGAQCLGSLDHGERGQVVVCGMESHVCVLQTVLDLRDSGRQIFVVADAVSSRRASDKSLALDRMRQHGVELVSREMVAFEWLRVAGTPLFREISREYLR